MKITPDLELNVSEAVKDPNIGLQGAAVLLLCYDLADEDRTILASQAELYQLFNTQSMELIARVIEIGTRLDSADVLSF